MKSLERTGAGEQALQRRRGRLLRYLHRQGTPPEDAEDLLQDLSEVALRHELPDHPEAAARWLFASLRWLIARRRRHHAAMPPMLDSALDEVLPLDNLPADGADPSQAVMDQIVCEQVLLALDHLQQPDRELLLAVADGTPAAALARAEGVSRQAVSERVLRARRQLVAAMPYDVFET